MNVFIVFYSPDGDSEIWCGAWHTEQEAKNYISRFKGEEHLHTIERYTLGEEY